MKLEGILAQRVPGPAQFGLSDIKYLSPLDFILKRSLPLCVGLCVLCVHSVHMYTEDDLGCSSAGPVHLTFLRQSLSVAWMHSEQQGSLCLCLSYASVTSVIWESNSDPRVCTVSASPNGPSFLTLDQLTDIGKDIRREFPFH